MKRLAWLLLALSLPAWATINGVDSSRVVALRSAAEAIAQIQVTHSTIRQAVEDFLPADLPEKGGLLMVAGTTAYPILAKLQEKVINMLDKIK